MSLGTVDKRARALADCDEDMLPLPSGVDSASSRAAACEIFYLSGECDALDFLINADFTAAPTEGVSRLKVVFRNTSTGYDYIQEVEQSTVNKFIVEIPCETHYIQEVPQ